MSRVVFIHSKQAHRYRFSNRYLTTDYLKEIYGLFFFPDHHSAAARGYDEQGRKIRGEENTSLKKKKLPSFVEAEKKQLAALKKKEGRPFLYLFRWKIRVKEIPFLT